MKLLYYSKTHAYDNIWTFAFEPLESITWIAGQSIRLELPAEFGTEERRFSIASAPYESLIHITTRISNSDFKQTLNSLEPGDHVDAYAIEGDFIWQPGMNRKIFCIAGMGITAVIPIIKQLAYEHAAIPATLLYANHDARFLYKDSLASVAALHPECKVVHLPGSKLNAALVQKYCPNAVTQKIYIAGPSQMVDALNDELLAVGVPESNIINDWFTGRSGWDSV